MRTTTLLAALVLPVIVLGCSNTGTSPADDDDTITDADDDVTADDDDATVADCDDIDPLDVGIYHRESAEECPATRAPLNPAPSTCGSSEADECSTHDDCTDGPNGRCGVADESGRCGCGYDQCFSDAECSATSVCICAEQYPFELNTNNTCRPADCQTDADCDTGLCMGEPFFCGAAEPGDTMWITRFSCATASDECRNHETCYCDGSPQRCHPGEGGAWVCSNDYMAACE
jgi:hypothetical protein